jgi:D-inositol-3-phosphate glycosyltransferase
MTPNRCRIASLCTSPSWGGLELNVIRFLVWMQLRGWEVRLYADPDTRLYREASERGIPVGAVRSRLRYGDVVNARRLARLLRQDGIRFLVINQSPDMFVGVVAGMMAGASVKTLYQQHMHVGGAKRDWYHRWLYGHFAAWVTPVQWLADRVLEKTYLAPDVIHVIPLGIEMEQFTALLPDRLSARRRYGLTENDVVIGMVGRLDPKKCQDIVVEAVARLRAEGHPCHLLLVGSQSYNEGDEYVAALHRRVKALGPHDTVHFVPNEMHVAWAYAGLDIFVLASTSECYGMVTIEAMASGIPVVATNDGGTVSLVHHDRNGLLVTPRKVEELVAALRRLLEHPDQAQQLAATARTEAVAKYSHTAQCEAWETLLTQLTD